ncbi:hypothetical protein [Streptomyces yunnanensis]|uniref:Uncharacterized protein n=1 Tax=Streptomyces yunnanensis TaxID=156453 RepID=A0A9X8R0E8_9ACTN|nr:hypothetical protein [Streptomyces yunnanensis]SHN33890.1 hypothetical protein SAMN05216268_1419 [Streptomyces yunnanensis]
MVVAPSEGNTWNVSFGMRMDFPLLAGVSATLYIEVHGEQPPGACGTEVNSAAFDAYGSLTVRAPDSYGLSVSLNARAWYSADQGLALDASWRGEDVTIADAIRLFGLQDALPDVGDAADTGGTEDTPLGLKLSYRSRDRSWSVGVNVGAIQAGLASIPPVASGSQ